MGFLRRDGTLSGRLDHPPELDTVGNDPEMVDAGIVSARAAKDLVPLSLALGVVVRHRTFHHDQVTVMVTVSRVLLRSLTVMVSRPASFRRGIRRFH